MGCYRNLRHQLLELFKAPGFFKNPGVLSVGLTVRLGGLAAGIPLLRNSHVPSPRDASSQSSHTGSGSAFSSHFA